MLPTLATLTAALITTTQTALPRVIAQAAAGAVQMQVLEQCEGLQCRQDAQLQWVSGAQRRVVAWTAVPEAALRITGISADWIGTAPPRFVLRLENGTALVVEALEPGRYRVRAP